MDSSRQAEGREWRGGDGSGVEGRAGQGRVPDCLGGLSRVGISSRSTRPWNGQSPSLFNTDVDIIMLEETYSISCRPLLKNYFIPSKFGISLRIRDNYSWK